MIFILLLAEYVKLQVTVLLYANNLKQTLFYLSKKIFLWEDG